MRRTGLTVSILDLGHGEVNSVDFADALLPMDRALIAGPPSPRAANCRLLDGVAKPRPGYVAFADTPASSAVTGLFQATFDTNLVENLRSDAASTYYLTGGNTWTAISNSAGAGGQWTYAMVRRATVSPANQVMFGADGDSDIVKVYQGSGAAAVDIGAALFKGAKAIIGHRGRGLVMNVFDMGLTARKTKRVRYSIVGNPETFTGFGSGFVDLDDDPYPIANAKVIAGNICVFNGNNIAGSIVVGTLTGVTNNPYRWDTINTGDVGLLVPKSLVQISAGLAFFLGHDGFYLYDGARGLAPIAQTIGRDILTRINPAQLDTGHAWIKPATGEIHVALSMGSATTPNEVWVFNFKERRVYGPYLYANNITAASPFATTSTLTWDTIPSSAFAGGVAEWDNFLYPSWDEMGAPASARSMIYGASDGTTWLDDETSTADNATAVTATYTFAPLRAHGRTITFPDGSQRILEEDAYLTLQDVTLTFRNSGSWTPIVDVSTDGGTAWTTLAGVTAVGSGASNIGRTLTASYSTSGISGTWFQLRVGGTAPMQLSGVRMEYNYGGNARND